MNLDRIYEFTIIAKTENLSAAASELRISAATLSARLKTLEADLGCPLFLRRHNRLTLSPEGTRFLIDAQEIVEDYASLSGTLSNIMNSNAYTNLRIAILGSTMPPHLGPFLDRVNLQHPNLHLQLLDDSAYSIQNGLLRKNVDLYFAPAASDISYEGIERTNIAFCPPRLFVSKSHPLSSRSTVSIHELDGETFILYPRTAEPLLREYQLKCLADAGIRYQLYTDDSSPVFYHLLVPIGKGILLAPTLESELPPNTVSLGITDIPRHVYESLFYLKTGISSEVRTFLKDYHEFAKEALKRGNRASL